MVVERQRLVEVPVSSAEDAPAAKSASAEAPAAPPRGVAGKVFRDDLTVQTMLLLPPPLGEWLPAEHLARFVDELVEQHLDLGPFYAAHTNTKGFPPWDPRMMLKLLLYGYLTGCRSSRKLETSCVEQGERFRGRAHDARSDLAERVR